MTTDTKTLLDTVEPDVYETEYGFMVNVTSDFLTGEKQFTEYYSRESVESIIEAVKAETRKKVLLEAADIVDRAFAAAKATEDAHYRHSAQPFKLEDFGFDIREVRYSQAMADKLRRMAESDKGGK